MPSTTHPLADQDDDDDDGDDDDDDDDDVDDDDDDDDNDVADGNDDDDDDGDDDDGHEPRIDISILPLRSFPLTSFSLFHPLSSLFSHPPLRVR